MKKEARKGECKKCGEFFYVHAHHIFPKSIFGKGEVVDLCPNCHTHCHEYNNLHVKNPQDAEEVNEVWKEWLRDIIIVSVLLGVFLSLNSFI